MRSGKIEDLQHCAELCSSGVRICPKQSLTSIWPVKGKAVESGSRGKNVGLVSWVIRNAAFLSQNIAQFCTGKNRTPTGHQIHSGGYLA
jgi:hypothetical protein